ncbi:MAG: PilZ domain-containing protein [Candidatus Igneacidithiobacillus chanchocoensis]
MNDQESSTNQMGRDPASLVRLLPMRNGMNIADYHLRVIGDFDRDSIQFGIEKLCSKTGCPAMLFSADLLDPGHAFVFQSCTAAGLELRPVSSSVWSNYQKLLFIVQSADGLFSGFCALEGIDSRGVFHLHRPNILYYRDVRLHRRLHLDGEILLRRKNSENLSGLLNDFSPTGVSFFVRNAYLDRGEVLLASFAVPGCGECDATARVVRSAPGSATLGSLVGLQLLLTKSQQQRMEHLHFCLQHPNLRHREQYSNH